RLGGMRREYELDRRAAGAGAQLVRRDGGEPGERVLERLARHLPVACVLAAPPQAVVLLGQVGELEVETERAEHERLCVRPERAHELRARDGAVAPRVARRRPD